MPRGFRCTKRKPLGMNHPRGEPPTAAKQQSTYTLLMKALLVVNSWGMVKRRTVSCLVDDPGRHPLAADKELKKLSD